MGGSPSGTRSEGAIWSLGHFVRDKIFDKLYYNLYG